MNTFKALAQGKVDGFDDGMQEFLKLMSREVIKQKKRLGGDFAVAHAVVSRYVQRWFKKWSPGFENFSGELSQNW